MHTHTQIYVHTHTHAHTSWRASFCCCCLLHSHTHIYTAKGYLLAQTHTRLSFALPTGITPLAAISTSELLGRFERFNEGSAIGDHRVDLHPRWVWVGGVSGWVGGWVGRWVAWVGGVGGRGHWR